MGRIDLLEEGVEELQNRVSQLENILSDLAKWTGFGCKFKDFTKKVKILEKPREAVKVVDRVDPGPKIVSSFSLGEFGDVEDVEHPLKTIEMEVEVGGVALKCGFEEEFKMVEYDLTAKFDSDNDDDKCEEDDIDNDKHLSADSDSNSNSNQDPDWTGGANNLKVSANSHSQKRKQILTPFKSLTKCQKCQVVFSSATGLKIHKATKHGIGVNGPPKCFLCPGAPTFANSSKLRDHVRARHPSSSDKSFLCPHCPKNFSSKQNLQCHINLHLGTKPYKCDNCPYQTSWSSILSQHKKTCRSGVETQVQVTQNDDSNGGENEDEEDRNSLEGGQPSNSTKPNKCPHCPSKFQFGSQLQLHLRSHSDQQPFKCPHDFCTFTASSRVDLVVHAHKLHPNSQGSAAEEKNEACPYCPKVFKTKQNLRWHVNIHTGAKPYECDKCDAKYAQQPTLISHRKSCKGRSRNAAVEGEEEVLVLSD